MKFVWLVSLAGATGFRCRQANSNRADGTFTKSIHICRERRVMELSPRSRSLRMRLDFVPPDGEADARFQRWVRDRYAALDAAVEAEDYAKAQTLKGEIDEAAVAEAARKEAAWISAAAATFTTDAEVDAVASSSARGGFRYDTSASPATRPAIGTSNAFSGQVSMDYKWTEELAELVCSQMVDAFDNYPPAEVEGLLSALVEASSQQDAEAERSLRKLADLARQMEALKAEAQRGVAAWEYLEDEASAVRSQIRMWGKDGERYQRR